MANCSNILTPSDGGGSMTCGMLQQTLDEVKVMCSELNALSGGNIYFHDETPGASPASPTAPATIPATVVDGTVVIEFYDSETNYWKYDDTGGTWTLFFQRIQASSSGAPNISNLSANATISIQWWGVSAPQFVETVVGTYTLTVPTGTRVRSLQFTGGTGTLDSSQLILQFVDTDGKSLHFSDPYLLNLTTNERVDLGLLGINPTQDASLAGTVVSTWVNMNLASFRISLNFS